MTSGPGRSSSRSRFTGLLARDRLLAQRHEGFWAPMDTLKDKQSLESLHESGRAPWERWAAAPEADRDLVAATG